MSLSEQVNGYSETPDTSVFELSPQEELAPIVAIGGLLTIKQVAQWYRPMLAQDGESELPASKRFIAPPKRGLGSIDEMHEELHDRLDTMQSKLQGKKLFLVGHSLGGLMATKVALERPDMVAGVVSLGGVHAGYDRDTFATVALKKFVGKHPEAGHLRHDSDFMLEHTSNMENDWPAGVPLHIVSTPFDALIVPPQGYDVEIAGGKPDKKLVIPKIPGFESLVRKRLGIGDDVGMLKSHYFTEHINLPRNPDVARYVRQSRQALTGTVPEEATPQGISLQELPQAA